MGKRRCERTIGIAGEPACARTRALTDGGADEMMDARTDAVTVEGQVNARTGIRAHEGASETYAHPGVQVANQD